MTAKNKRPTEPRRANKPLMEKRRRARINQSLAALKTLILDSAKADNTKHSKLEKADILELTVRHFQRHRSLDVKGVNQYKAGYSDCVKEVQRYLETPDVQTMTVIDNGVKQRLLRHLDSCIAEVDMDLRNTTNNSTSVTTTATTTTTTLTAAASSATTSPTASINERLQREDLNSSVRGGEEEVNNNKQPINDQAGFDKKMMVKNYDGNFVLLLPEHYLQLATALGVNLRTPSEHHELDDRMMASGSTNTSHVKTDNETKAEKEINNNPIEALDFRKNNDGNGDMWRPW